jgi:hypothetical protein
MSRDSIAPVLRLIMKVLKDHIKYNHYTENPPKDLGIDAKVITSD